MKRKTSPSGLFKMRIIGTLKGEEFGISNKETPDTQIVWNTWPK